MEYKSLTPILKQPIFLRVIHWAVIRLGTYTPPWKRKCQKRFLTQMPVWLHIGIRSCPGDYSAVKNKTWRCNTADTKTRHWARTYNMCTSTTYFNCNVILHLSSFSKWHLSLPFSHLNILCVHSPPSPRNTCPAHRNLKVFSAFTPLRNVYSITL